MNPAQSQVRFRPQVSPRCGRITLADGKAVAERVYWFDTFGLRLRGLLARPALQPGEGALLVPCRSVHCLGMRYTIDAVYLSPDGEVLRTLTIRPNGLGPHVARAAAVLELPAGSAAAIGLALGKRLVLHPPK